MLRLRNQLKVKVTAAVAVAVAIATVVVTAMEAAVERVKTAAGVLEVEAIMGTANLSLVVEVLRKPLNPAALIEAVIVRIYSYLI